MGLVLAVLAALALVGINESGYRRSSRALADIVEGTQHARSTLNLLLQHVLDAETGQRGYLLTGEARYREPYDRAIGLIDGNLGPSRRLYADASGPAGTARPSSASTCCASSAKWT